MRNFKFSNILVELTEEEVKKMNKIDQMKRDKTTSIYHCQYGSTPRRYGGAFTV